MGAKLASCHAQLGSGVMQEKLFSTQSDQKQNCFQRTLLPSFIIFNYGWSCSLQHLENLIAKYNDETANLGNNVGVGTGFLFELFLHSAHLLCQD